MLFNSFEFALFLSTVFAVYWLIDNPRIQNGFLVLASFVFYGWWDWRFLGLIVLSGLTDYLVGLGLSVTREQRTRRGLVLCSLVINLGILATFKYYDFFAESLGLALEALGVSLRLESLGLVLPVGISFYTFQTLGYLLDVYRGKLPAERDPVALFAYVSFFPQLVAGPIERGANLLPQFRARRSFDPEAAADGLRQILWGLFKKVVVADNCAVLVDAVFDHHAEQPSAALALAAVLFSFQIYGDFSGYSDIAIGTARLFGFSLMRNFAYPYFSRDLTDFWRRWHISLSTWFRDYVYIPLGGSRGGTRKTARNILVVFLLSGLWHGANWTYVAWGFVHACFFLPSVLSGRRTSRVAMPPKLVPGLREVFGILRTFTVTTFAFVLFRAPTLADAVEISRDILTWSRPGPMPPSLRIPLSAVIVMLVLEWIRRARAHALEVGPSSRGRPLRWLLYVALLLALVFFAAPQRDFLYFQF